MIEKIKNGDEIHFDWLLLNSLLILISLFSMVILLGYAYEFLFTKLQCKNVEYLTPKFSVLSINNRKILWKKENLLRLWTYFYGW